MCLSEDLCCSGSRKGVGRDKGVNQLLLDGTRLALHGSEELDRIGAQDRVCITQGMEKKVDALGLPEVAKAAAALKRTWLLGSVSSCARAFAGSCSPIWPRARAARWRWMGSSAES